MNCFDTAQWFIEQCECAAHIDELRQALHIAFRRLGFRYFACGSHVDPLNPRQAVMILNYPEQWVQLYSELQLHCIDPVFLRADRTLLPFFWDADDFKAEISPSQHRMLREARRFGIEHGYTIPIHSPRSAFIAASCSVIPEARSLEPYSYFAAQLMACYLFETAAPSWDWLANRRHALTSARDNDSAWHSLHRAKATRISPMLTGLRPCTVHNYIEKAKSRFDVATRVQAVVHALASYQISFLDAIPMRRNPVRHRFVRLRSRHLKSSLTLTRE